MLRRCSRPWRRAALDGILPLRDHLDGRTLHVPSNVSNAQIPAIPRTLIARSFVRSHVLSRPSDATTGDGARPSARRAYPPGRKRGRTPFSVLALWAARIAIRPALPTPAAARPERARASRQQAIPADRRSRRELRVCGVVRALNCIVRPAQWVRGGRLAKGAAFAGEAAFGSRLGKREASATTRTSSAETVRRLGIRLEATPRLRQAQSACRSARGRAGL